MVSKICISYEVKWFCKFYVCCLLCNVYCIQIFKFYNNIWNNSISISDEYDAYIIVSFVNATLVLSIGDTVEEVTDSGFLGTTPTLCCSSLGDDALVQVYPEGIRHIRADKRVNEWKAPGKKTISKCAVNQRQVVIALSGGELVYFEMDPVSVVQTIF